MHPFAALMMIMTAIWVSGAQASPFVGEKVREPIAKAYRFVTSKVPDPVDRAECPIRVDYVPLDGYVGFAPRKEKGMGCSDVIEITSGLERDWKSGLVMAHELMHVFRRARNLSEVPWLDEGIAKLVEHQYLGIGPITLHDELLKLEEVALETRQGAYRDNSPAYVTAYFFALYLYNRLGEDAFLKELIASPLSGWDAIETVALKLRRAKVIAVDEKYLTRESLWTHFAFALLLNDSEHANHALFSLDTRYKAVRKAKSSLLRDRYDVSSGAGWRIRFFRLPLSKASAAIESNPNSAFYLLKDRAGFQVRPIQAPLQGSDVSARDFDYLVEVTMGD